MFTLLRYLKKNQMIRLLCIGKQCKVPTWFNKNVCVRVHTHTLGLNIIGSSAVWCVYSKSFACCVLFFAYCLHYVLILSLGKRWCVISSFTSIILLECYQKILLVTANVLGFFFFFFFFLYSSLFSAKLVWRKHWTGPCSSSSFVM